MRQEERRREAERVPGKESEEVADEGVQQKAEKGGSGRDG